MRRAPRGALFPAAREALILQSLLTSEPQVSIS
jgi:hypothetical protein